MSRFGRGILTFSPGRLDMRNASPEAYHKMLCYVLQEVGTEAAPCRKIMTWYPSKHADGRRCVLVCSQIMHMLGTALPVVDIAMRRIDPMEYSYRTTVSIVVVFTLAHGRSLVAGHKNNSACSGRIP